MNDSSELKSLLLAAAEKAARTTGSSVRDVFRRDHSARYLLRVAKRIAPDVPVDELRRIIAELRGVASDDAPAAEKKPRPPSRGHEPLESPVWDERIEQLLAACLPHPGEILTTDELMRHARRHLGWSASLFSSVMAAADGRGILTFANTGAGREWWGGMWARPAAAKQYEEQIKALRANADRRSNACSDATNGPTTRHAMGEPEPVGGQEEDESGADHSTDRVPGI